MKVNLSSLIVMVSGERRPSDEINPLTYKVLAGYAAQRRRLSAANKQGQSLTPVVWMNAVLLVAAALAAALLHNATIRHGLHTDGSPVLAEVRGLFRISRFRILILVSALVYGSHAMHDAFAVLRWSDAGMDASVISVLWSEAVAAEVLVFFLIGPALLRGLGARGAAVLAAGAGFVRWSVEGVTTFFVLLSMLQPLHGLTFALLHLAACFQVARFDRAGRAWEAEQVRRAARTPPGI